MNGKFRKNWGSNQKSGGHGTPRPPLRIATVWWKYQWLSFCQTLWPLLLASDYGIGVDQVWANIFYEGPQW